MRRLEQREGLSDTTHWVLGEQPNLDAPPEKRLERSEVVVDVDRLHRLSKAGKIALDTWGREILKTACPEGVGAPPQDTGVTVDGPDGVIADASA